MLFRSQGMTSEAASKQQDDWETDPDYVNDVTEEQQRWGGRYRDAGHIDMDNLRHEVRQEDSLATERRMQEDGYKTSGGYGGKFGVQEDRRDKSAEGWDYNGKTEEGQYSDK